MFRGSCVVWDTARVLPYDMTLLLGDVMKILYVASEALPFAASGGLGDVMGSLPAAVSSCLGEGSDVRVIMPMYKSVKDKFSSSLFFEREIYVPLAWRRQFCGIWSTERGGVKYYFLDN